MKLHIFQWGILSSLLIFSISSYGQFDNSFVKLSYKFDHTDLAPIAYYINKSSGSPVLLNQRKDQIGIHSINVGVEPGFEFQRAIQIFGLDWESLSSGVAGRGRSVPE